MLRLNEINKLKKQNYKLVIGNSVYEQQREKVKVKKYEKICDSPNTQYNSILAAITVSTCKQATGNTINHVFYPL